MKINGIKVNGDIVAFDGCYKFYILEDEDDFIQARANGYIEWGRDLFDINDLEWLFNENNCSLVFIYNWKLNKKYVEQFYDGEVVFEYEKRGNE